MEPAMTDVEAPSLTLQSSKSVSINVPSGDPITLPSNQQDHDSTAFVDRVAWPINRCCYEELKSNELTAIEQLFVARDDAPSFMKWVVCHKPPHTFVKLLLVLSSFRLVLFKRTQTPFKSSVVVSREYQFLHLDEISVLRLTTVQPDDPTALGTSIKLQFHAPKHHCYHDLEGPEDPIDSVPTGREHRALELHFDPGIHAETIVRLCQRTLHAMRLVFAHHQLPRLVLPPTCPWQEFFTVHGVNTHRKEYGDALSIAYRCFCDDLDVPFRSSVVTRLRECLEVASIDVQYCLSATSMTSYHTPPVIPAQHHDARGRGHFTSLGRWIGIYGFSGTVIQAREALALARTIEHGHCFDEIVVYDLTMNDVALRSLCYTLVPATENIATVKGLVFTNVGLTTCALRTLQHIVLQASIRRSTAVDTPSSTSSLPLRRLDLSFNKFSGLMAHGLATILELLPSGLETLHLEQCRLTMLASARILTAMKSNHGFSSCLRELNLSGNTLGIEGTKTLAMWITGAFALHRLDLSRTRLQTNTFFQSFKQNSILHESSLISLDLSYNHMGTQASVDLGDILGKTQSLSTIVLRGMKQTLLHPRRILSDVLSQPHRQKPTLTTVSDTTKRTTRGLRTLHLRNIVGPMLQNSSRSFPCMIDLSENNLHGPKATALAHLLDSAPNAALASLRIDDAALTDKAAVLLLHSLRSCKSLVSLGLEGNGFVHRTTKRSYKRFHGKFTNPKPHIPSVLERAAGDALSLLLGGKSAHTESESNDSGHSFTHLYHHRPKRVPLRELSLRARGHLVFGEWLLTTAVQALAINTTLHMLDVSGNECGDALAQALGTMLPTNQSLQVLYWDDNFTTVDGFFAFYDGLLRNHTLSVVQLPIRDTRRILEEQKDPPREKLFSVLGKIFKVTERNQSHDKRARQKHPPTTTKSPRRKPKTPKSENQVPETATPTIKLLDDEPEEKHNDDTSPTHVDDVDIHTDDTTWTRRYTTRTRYPTTIQSWAHEGPTTDVDVRASWDQIGSLASMLT